MRCSMPPILAYRVSITVGIGTKVGGNELTPSHSSFFYPFSACRFIQHLPGHLRVVIAAGIVGNGRSFINGKSNRSVQLDDLLEQSGQ